MRCGNCDENVTMEEDLFGGMGCSSHDHRVGCGHKINECGHTIMGCSHMIMGWGVTFGSMVCGGYMAVVQN